MSKSANKKLIGIFVLGATVLLVVAILVLGSGMLFTKTFKAVCFFERLAGELDPGAPVVFNGVKIGSVTDVVLRYNTTEITTVIPVYIEIDPQHVKIVGPRPESFEDNLRLLIDRGLKARLQLRSVITGKLQVGLDYYPDKPVRFLEESEEYPEIPTIPTPVQEITQKIEELPLEETVRDIATAVEQMNSLVPEIAEMTQSVSLAADQTKFLAQNLNRHVEPLSGDMKQTFQKMQKLLMAIDVKTTTLTSRIDGTMKNVRDLVQNIDTQIAPPGPSIQQALVSIQEASQEAETTLRQARQSLLGLHGNENSEFLYELNRTIEEIGTAARAVRGLAKSLERQPESLFYGREEK